MSAGSHCTRTDAVIVLGCGAVWLHSFPKLNNNYPTAHFFFFFFFHFFPVVRRQQGFWLTPYYVEIPQVSYDIEMGAKIMTGDYSRVRLFGLNSMSSSMFTTSYDSAQAEALGGCKHSAEEDKEGRKKKKKKTESENEEIRKFGCWSLSFWVLCVVHVFGYQLFSGHCIKSNRCKTKGHTEWKLDGSALADLTNNDWQGNC